MGENARGCMCLLGESYYSINLDFDIVCMGFDSQKNFCYNMIVRLRKPFYIYL